MDDVEPQKAPRLPGVPLSETETEAPVEEINPLIKLAAQFFVIPFVIVVLCVALVFVFRWLTWEKRDLSSYLNALNSATRPAASRERDALKLLSHIQEAKRWQSIYDVTERLRFNRKQFLAENPEFPTKVARIFQQSGGADRRVRQYLAQVLGLVGGPEVLPVLIMATEDSDAETAIHSIIALGRIGDAGAVPPLLQASQSEDRGLRQTAIFALGNFKDPRAATRCAEALHDPDLLVTWNAAFALARQDDARAMPLLERFLDADYPQRVAQTYSPSSSALKNEKTHGASTFRPDQLEQYRVTAIRLLGRLALNNLSKSGESVLREKLRRTANQDPNLKARQAAIEALKKGR